MEKYFPEDMCTKKKIDFLKLRHGNMTLVEYVSKFEELVKFFPR